MTLDQIETTAALMGWYWAGCAPYRTDGLGYLYGLRKDDEEYCTFEHSTQLPMLDRVAVLPPSERPENEGVRERLLNAWSKDHDT